VGEKWPQEAVLERGRVGHRPTEKLRQKKKSYLFPGSICKQNISRPMVAIILDYKKKKLLHT
jgi:hypothetical protein